MKGRYGHTATYDPTTNIVFVYGGYFDKTTDGELYLFHVPNDKAKPKWYDYSFIIIGRLKSIEILTCRLVSSGNSPIKGAHMRRIRGCLVEEGFFLFLKLR